jgi:hypothetical protein
MRRSYLAVIMLTALVGVGSDAGHAAPDAAANGVAMPAGYRDWKLIAVAREEGALDDVRAILGNDIAVKAARDGTLPFPDGAMIARLAWSFEPLAESTQAFGHPQSHVSGPPKNGVQFMVKDATRYAATGGWGFAQFDDGKPSNAGPAASFACHSVVRDRDLVFNRYAP